MSNIPFAIRKKWADIAFVMILVGWIICIPRYPRISGNFMVVAFFALAVAVYATSAEK
jgi:hypothetical protein